MKNSLKNGCKVSLKTVTRDKPHKFASKILLIKIVFSGIGVWPSNLAQSKNFRLRRISEFRKLAACKLQRAHFKFNGRQIWRINARKYSGKGTHRYFVFFGTEGFQYLSRGLLTLQT